MLPHFAFFLFAFLPDGSSLIPWQGNSFDKFNRESRNLGDPFTSTSLAHSFRTALVVLCSFFFFRFLFS